MASIKPTPEEKLFAVIQGAQHPPLRRTGQALSLAGLGTRVMGAMGTIGLPRINQGLGAVIAVLGMFALGTPLLMRPRLETLMARAPVFSAPIKVAPLEGLRPAEEYLETMTHADPFRVGEAPPVEPPPVILPPPPPAPDPKELLRDVKLVGISWGEEPVAMIEQNQQTSFLKTGATIGPFTIKEILKDRVILRLGERDVELF